MTITTHDPVAAARVAVALPNEDEMVLLEEQYPVPSPDDASLITVTETPTFFNAAHTPGSAWFNGMESLQTREITVTGVQIPFDGSLPILESLRTTRDVTKMTLIADEVVIEEPLAWKGADVEVVARRLTFRGQGCISTQPEPYGVAAFTESRDDAGHPLPSNGTVKGKDGLPGCDAGSITLRVQDLELGNPGVVRFDCRGGDGQKGEPGGHLPRPDKRPVNATTVSMKTITDAIRNSQNSTGDLNGLGYWYYPAGDATRAADGELGLTTDLYGHLAGRDLIKQGLVSHVRLVFIYYVYEGLKSTGVDLPNVARNHKFVLEVTDPNRPRAGTTYPSGTTGRGGRGGDVIVPDGLAGKVALCHRGDGGASPRSDDVVGQRGTPDPYYVLTCVLWQHDAPAMLGKPKSLSYRASRHEAEAADNQQGTAVGNGDAGVIKSNRESAWCDPRLLRTVLTYARCLASAGHRADALSLIDPYVAAATPVESDDLGVGTNAQAMTTLYTNLATNLDVYGNPGGWVPRFSADNYFQLYLADRAFSYRFAYAMAKAQELSDTVANAWQVLDHVSAMNDQHIDQLHGDLGRAYADFHNAQETLDQAIDHLAGVEKIVESIRQQATTDAAEKAKRDAVINAVCTTAGAICTALPVGQPYLSGAGALIKGVGAGLTSVDDSKGFFEQSLEFLGGLSTSVSTTLEANANTFKDQFDARLKAKYAGKVDASTKDLKKQVETARTGLTEAKKAADAKTAATYTSVISNAELAALLDKANDPKITELANDRAALKAKIDEASGFISELSEVRGSDPEILAYQLASIRRQNLVAARTKLYAQLTDLDDLLAKRRQAAADASATLEQRKQAMADLDEAKKARDAVGEKQKKFDELVGDLDQKESENADTKARETFATVVTTTTNLAKGLSASTASIQSALRPFTADDQDVQKLRDKLLGGPYHEQLSHALDELERAKTKRAAALQGFQDCNRRMLSGIADLHQSLETSVALSRSGQSLAVGIDAELKLQMAAMAQAAAERMDYYLYLVRKAYMYEQLAQVGAGVARLNDFTRRFDSWLASNQAALAGKGIPATIDLSSAQGQLTAVQSVAGSDLASMGDLVLRETLAELTETILTRRQITAQERTNSGLVVDLRADRLAALAETGSVAVPHIMDLFSAADASAFLSRHHRVRVAELKLESFEFTPRPSAPEAPVRLELTVGRSLPLRGDDGPDGKPRYFLYRMADGEAPITYGFVVSDLTTDGSSRRSGTITADSRVAADSFFSTIAARGSGGPVEYTELAPSVLASLKLDLVMGAEQIERIDRLKFRLTLKFDG